MKKEIKNAATTIRAMLGCYIPHFDRQTAPVKRKTVSYGANLKAHFDKKKGEQRAACNQGSF